MSRKKKKKKEELKKIKPKRFTAMSKIIGYVVAIVSISIIAFSMYEMHRLQNLDAIEFLILGALGLAATYIGFYINMAKAEHLEDKRSQVQKELAILRKNGVTEEEREKEQELKSILDGINTNLQELHSKEEVKHQ